MILTEVSFGFGRALRDGTVGISLLLREGTVIVGAEGLMGMAAMLWWRYQAKTRRVGLSVRAKVIRLDEEAKRTKGNDLCAEGERKNGWGWYK